MNEPQDSDGSSTNIVLIVLGIIGLVIVGCGGVIVVCMVAISFLGRSASQRFEAVANSIANQSPDPQAFADAVVFMNDVADGRTEAAYLKTTKAFQARQDLKSFRAKVEGNPAFKYNSNHFADDVSKGKIISVSIFSGPDGKVELTLIFEDGKWKVDDMTITPAKPK